MNKLVRRFRTLPIRARLSMLVAAAVAFAVAAVSVTCWFIVQGKLYEELNADLKSSVERAQPANQVFAALDTCAQSQSDAFPFGPRFKGYSQLVQSSGKACICSSSNPS